MDPVRTLSSRRGRLLEDYQKCSLEEHAAVNGKPKPVATTRLVWLTDLSARPKEPASFCMVSKYGNYVFLHKIRWRSGVEHMYYGRRNLGWALSLHIAAYRVFRAASLHLWVKTRTCLLVIGIEEHKITRKGALLNMPLILLHRIIRKCQGYIQERSES